MRNLLTYILLILAFGCSTNSRNERNINPETTTTKPSTTATEPSNEPEPLDLAFAQFLELIPEIELPFETYCDANWANPDIDQELTNRYSKTDWYVAYRKITTGKDFQLVIFKGLADPMFLDFYTFSNSGDTISTKAMIGGCLWDMGYRKYQKLKIDEFLNMTSFDSTLTFELDEDYNKIEGTEKSGTKTTYYLLNDDGMIVEK